VRGASDGPHLFLVGLGGVALVSQLVGAWVERADPARRALLPQAPAVAAAAVAFVVLVRGVLSPIALPIRATIPGDVSRGLDRIEALVPRTKRWRRRTSWWSTRPSSTCVTS
jgi:hypothetical protein